MNDATEMQAELTLAEVKARWVAGYRAAEADGAAAACPYPLGSKARAFWNDGWVVGLADLSAGRQPPFDCGGPRTAGRPMGSVNGRRR